jgi:large subunit ribosomal protein L31
MKEGIHPNYRDVCFVDLSNGFKFVTRSCVNTKEMIKMEDGRELPLFKLDTSSESHPFYTGTQKSVNDMGGRVDKFFKKFGKTAWRTCQVSGIRTYRPRHRKKGSPGNRLPFFLARPAACDTLARVNQPTPAIVAQSAVRRLPRLALLLFCAAYVLPGFIGREPWKNADIMAFGYMYELAGGAPTGWRPSCWASRPNSTPCCPTGWAPGRCRIAPAWMAPTSPRACPSSCCWC